MNKHRTFLGGVFGYIYFSVLRNDGLNSLHYAESLSRFLLVAEN